MRCLLILSATLCVAQPWWTVGNPFIRYPSFLRQASFEARAAFADICKNGTLTRAQREDALDKWAAQYNLMDAYNSYKNTTERARANRQLAVMRGLDELQKFFTELGKIRVDPNITADQESEAIRKLCESLDRPTRMAVYYLQGIYGSRAGSGGFGFAKSRLFGAPLLPLATNGAARSLLWK